MPKSRGNVESSWLRLLAPFEKNTIFLHTSDAKGCPSAATLAGLAAGTYPVNAALDKHIRRCPECVGLLQLLEECETVLDDPRALREVPRALQTELRRFTRVAPPRLPFLVLRLDHGPTIIRNTLSPPPHPDQDTLLSEEGGLRLWHASLTVRLCLVIRETDTGWSLSLSGRMPDGGPFPGEPVLVDRFGKLFSQPQVMKASGFHFPSLPPGIFTLTILLPSKKGVVEMERLCFFVHRVTGC